MPVVDIDMPRLRRLLGRIPTGRILEALPLLGLDIESESGDTVRIEYSPNRPDYSTEYGIALGLEGLLDIHTGNAGPVLHRPLGRITTYPSVLRIRPVIMAVCAIGGSMDDHMMAQLIAMQEDLHFGVGRRRKKSSIGMHDYDRVSFPLMYTTVDRLHKFVPLDGDRSMSVSEILAGTAQGRSYGHLLGGRGPVPAILDAAKRLISLPPIINSKATSMTTDTRNLLVEVTGHDTQDVAGTLSVISLTLQRAGFAVHPVRIPGVRSSAISAERRMNLDPRLVGATLGLEMTPDEIVLCLGRARISAAAQRDSVKCTIPSYRFDILGPMDLVEEVALGCGIDKMAPRLLPSPVSGNAGIAAITAGRIDDIMTGLGYSEVLNTCLSSMQALYGSINRGNDRAITTLDSNLEHQCLRDSLLPGLLDCLSRNIHHAYPQRLYETGVVFGPGRPVGEHASLAAVSAHRTACFSEMKSVLQEAHRLALGGRIRTVPSDDPAYQHGTCAEILAGDRRLGVMGQVDPEVLRGLRIRVPVAGFEIRLD